ncbi:MAG: 2-oxoglutarate dehydrogenase E1 component [Bdellovibrionales bacterium]|nr:2-oxoglutarate dehydrogenase E1 component [Bdellovibrionales bacterium]
MKDVSSFQNQENLDITNLDYIEQEYEKFQSGDLSLSVEWNNFFKGLEFSKVLFGSKKDNLDLKSLNFFKLIQFYRNYGHLKAELTPLCISNKILKNETQKDLFNIEKFKLTPDDLKQSLLQTLKDPLLPKGRAQDIIDHLENSYCKNISVQTGSCKPEVREWFYKQMEQNSFCLNQDQQKQILSSLIKTESLEKFIHQRFVGAKRFSIEGVDSLIPMLEMGARFSQTQDCEEWVIGMAHRGRLNVLSTFMQKDVEETLVLFTNQESTKDKDSESHNFTGDVKYHIGQSSNIETEHGSFHCSLSFNPSHLEAINPVVCGQVRAKQRFKKNTETRKKVMPILIHGDAAFIGQGVSSETLQLSSPKGYTVGGSLHIILNNQLGFTTNPEDARSTRYSSDLGHSIKAPIILVNADNVEDCVRAMKIAINFRQTFGEDVIIEVTGYRRFGHNEADEPKFTQPKLYNKISSHPTVKNIYAKHIQNIVSTEDFKKEETEVWDNLQKKLDKIKSSDYKYKASVEKPNDLWKKYISGSKSDILKPCDTNIKKETLVKLVTNLSQEPNDFNLNSKIKRLLTKRKDFLDKNLIDWPTAELLAYASLRHEDVSVRISGQDVKRGTFSHRHAVFTDQINGKEYSALKEINKSNGEFCIYNSPLSEFAVLAYEYGNSIVDPSFLSIWEAQFGDFANGAQVIIDQFLSSGEQKWNRYSGLVLLLPHGHEGQGPEHSSARLERYLQLCAQGNMQVCNITTPANLFHVLRRQMKRNFKKPLVIMSPKSLLRHPKNISSVDDFCSSEFKEILEETNLVDPKKVESVILCSGKIFFELEDIKLQAPKKNQALCSIIRIEQLYPLDITKLTSYINAYPKLKKIIWVQEEPKNMGAYSYINIELQSLLQTLGLNHINFEYSGRPSMASTAEGSSSIHLQEQKRLILEALKKAFVI